MPLRRKTLGLLLLLLGGGVPWCAQIEPLLRPEVSAIVLGAPLAPEVSGGLFANFQRGCSLPMLCEAPSVDVRTIGLEVQRFNLLPQLLKTRPRSRNPKYLRGRTWRLKFLSPIVDGTKFDDGYYGRESKFSGYSSQTKPYRPL